MNDTINKLGTSRYSWFAPWMGVPVCTSVGVPRWMPGLDYVTGLKPVGAFGKTDDLEEFTAIYLERLDAWEDRIRADLLRLSAKWPGQRLVLLCYEDLTVSGQWCHRTIAAGWLGRRGLAVEEMPRHEHELDGVVKRPPARRPATVNVMPPPLF